MTEVAVKLIESEPGLGVYEARTFDLSVRTLPRPPELNDVVIADPHAEGKSVARPGIEHDLGRLALSPRLYRETHTAAITEERRDVKTANCG
jgi:hypothetical protein